MSPQVIARKKLIALFIAGLLFWLSYFSQYTILSPYIVEIGTLTQLGIIMSCLTVGALLLRPWLGHLADSHSRQWVMLLGLMAVAIAPIGYWIAPYLPTLMLFRGISGVGLAAIRTSYLSWAVDLAPRSDRVKVIGQMSLSQSMGTFIGPALCSWVWSWGGYSYSWLLMSSLAILGVLATLTVNDSVIPQNHSKISRSPILEDGDRRYWQKLSKPAISIPAVVMLIAGFMGATGPTFMPLLALSVAPDWNVGMFFSASAIASLIARIIVSQSLDRLGRGVFISLSLLCYILGMLIFSRARSGEQIILATGLAGIGFGLLIPAIAALIVDRSELHEQARLHSLVTVGMDIGLGAGPLFLAPLADWSSYQSVFAVCAGLGAIGLWAFAMLSNKTVSRSLYFALGKVSDDYKIKF